MPRLGLLVLAVHVITSLVGSAAAAEEYSVTFTATWSEQTHPL